MKKRTKLEQPRNKREDVRRAILSAVGAAGILVIGATIPNAVRALPMFGIGSRKYYARSALGRLFKNDLIRFEMSDGKRYLKLTNKGHTKLAMLELEHLEQKKPPRWDGKWRILIFDIKEVQRYQRDRMRAGLVDLGFTKLQNSVWVYPYDCEDMLFLLKTYYGFGKNVLYIIAEKIEHDIELRKHFNLPFEL